MLPVSSPLPNEPAFVPHEQEEKCHLSSGFFFLFFFLFWPGNFRVANSPAADPSCDLPSSLCDVLLAFVPEPDPTRPSVAHCVTAKVKKSLAQPPLMFFRSSSSLPGAGLPRKNRRLASADGASKVCSGRTRGDRRPPEQGASLQISRGNQLPSNQVLPTWHHTRHGLVPPTRQEKPANVPNLLQATLVM